ncbi:hypothetical protein GOP47_0028443 [Adiantum capillus-veneris]|nr:hypothetical protein GOP47_0028443 [Adiantum capillus-veneris]
MEAEAAEFRLSQQLHGHQEDVRGIGVCGEGKFATGSRDRTVRLWGPDDQNNYALEKTMIGHTSFVGPVVWISPNDQLPAGGLASGGLDTLVIVWNVQDSKPIHTLHGHESQVTSLVVDAEGDILSASQDWSVRRWRKGQCVEVLKGHQGPVQAVLILPSGEMITGSSDCTVKVWRGSKCIQTFLGHSDTVRGLAFMPNVGILSASHDGSVRLWSVNGDALLEMIGHTAIVYCVAANSSGDVASGSEDCFAKIWKNGTCCQSIQHPGCVWDVKFLPTGDLVTACSDGVVRVWTKDPSRHASVEEMEAYEAHLSAWRTQTKMVGGVKIQDLPGRDALLQPGTKNGQTKVIREGDNGVAYSWNAKEYNWDKIGEVVDGPGNFEGRPSLNGQQYDFVFDVDIEDGAPVRKLPYNRGDNPYTVADQWLLHEDLPLTYRQQVVEFILQNTGQNVPVVDTSFSDPYTGGNAYVPQQQPSWMNGPSISNAPQSHTLKHLPKKGMLLFDSAQFDGIIKKLETFNSSLAADEGTKGLALNEEELKNLHATVSILKDETHYHTSNLTDDSLLPLQKLLLAWPSSLLFPVIDILRMVLLHPKGADLCAQYAESGKDILKRCLQRACEPPDANQLMGIRAAVNCFRHSILKKWVSSSRSEILDLFADCHMSTKQNIRIAYSTLLLNYGVHLIDTKDEAGQIQVLSAALEIAGPQEQDPICRYRSLLAVGSLVSDGLVKSIALDLDVKALADSATASSEASISEVGRDILHVLK